MKADPKSIIVGTLVRLKNHPEWYDDFTSIHGICKRGVFKCEEYPGSEFVSYSDLETCYEWSNDGGESWQDFEKDSQ